MEAATIADPRGNSWNKGKLGDRLRLPVDPETYNLALQGRFFLGAEPDPARHAVRDAFQPCRGVAGIALA